MKQVCNNQCGNSWCCQCWLFQVEPHEEAIWLALNRGFRVYKMPDQLGPMQYVGVLEDVPCKHLKDGVCSIYEQRPGVCSEFPPKGQTMLVPDSCPYSGPGIIKHGELEEITLEELKKICPSLP